MGKGRYIIHGSLEKYLLILKNVICFSFSPCRYKAQTMKLIILLPYHQRREGEMITICDKHVAFGSNTSRLEHMMVKELMTS